MDFVSIRIITGDVARLVAFYEKATGVQANWPTEDFAELRTTRATLAIGSTRTVPLFAPGAARPADNHTVVIGRGGGRRLFLLGVAEAGTSSWCDSAGLVSQAQHRRTSYEQG